MEAEKKKAMVMRILRMAAEEKITIAELRGVLDDVRTAICHYTGSMPVPEWLSSSEVVDWVFEAKAREQEERRKTAADCFNSVCENLDRIQIEPRKTRSRFWPF